MNSIFREILWKQFGAAIDMLENALIACPPDLWNTDTKFWYVAYHTLFYLDYYSTDDPAAFIPTEPFTLSELDPAGILPNRVYSQAELLGYLKAGREKCFGLIHDIDIESLDHRFTNDYMDFSMPELLLYNLRHVQHHVGQLNLILRQQTDSAPKWVSRAQENF